MSGQPTRQVSTRCPRMGEHGQFRIVQTGIPGQQAVESVLPIPCPECYSVESRVIPWEEPGDKPDLSRLVPDHIEELLGIDPNDPLHQMASEIIDLRATLARVKKLRESLVVLGNLPIEERPDGLTASVEACKALAGDLGLALGEPTPCWCGGPVGPREPGDAAGLGCLTDIHHDWEQR